MTRALALAVLVLAAACGPAAPGAASERQYLTGQLLVAAPTMGDPRFAETVIYMISHDAEGAMGLVVNRALGTGPLALLLKTLGVEPKDAAGSVRLLYGGPVEPGRGFVLHSADFSGSSTRIVGGSVAVSFGTDVLEAIAAGAGPERSLIILGYAGWGPGQLEGELARESWLTAPADEALIFADDLDDVWQRAIANAGLSL